MCPSPFAWLGCAALTLLCHVGSWSPEVEHPEVQFISLLSTTLSLPPSLHPSARRAWEPVEARDESVQTFQLWRCRISSSASSQAPSHFGGECHHKQRALFSSKELPRICVQVEIPLVSGLCFLLLFYFLLYKNMFQRKGAQGQTMTNRVSSVFLPNPPEILFHPHHGIEIIFTSAAANA